MRLIHCKYSGRSRVGPNRREGGRIERSNEWGGRRREGEARAKPGNQLVYIYILWLTRDLNYELPICVGFSVLSVLLNPKSKTCVDGMNVAACAGDTINMHGL